jgi:hypothetical protein
MEHFGLGLLSGGPIPSPVLPDFLGTTYQNGQNTPNGPKFSSDYKMYKMTIKYVGTYTNIFLSKALQNVPKLEFLVRKYTIWQPCPT